jgi:hypothetical protein
MESVKYIFAEPEVVDGISIYPIHMRHYDEFMNVANILTISYDNFDVESIKKALNGGTLPLFDLIMLNYEQQKQLHVVIELFKKIFTFVCKQKIEYDEKLNIFLLEGTDLAIDRDNYDEIREIILRQNLIFTPPVYKNKLVQEWAELALQARAQSSLKITIEDMITTIVACNGMDINVLADYTIYQIKSIFQRVLKLKNYDATVLFKTVDGKINIDHFAEEIDMFKSPYDGIIKEDTHHKHIRDSLGGKL